MKSKPWGHFCFTEFLSKYITGDIQTEKGKIEEKCTVSFTSSDLLVKCLWAYVFVGFFGNLSFPSLRVALDFSFFFFLSDNTCLDGVSCNSICVHILLSCYWIPLSTACLPVSVFFTAGIYRYCWGPAEPSVLQVEQIPAVGRNSQALLLLSILVAAHSTLRLTWVSPAEIKQEVVQVLEKSFMAKQVIPVLLRKDCSGVDSGWSWLSGRSSHKHSGPWGVCTGAGCWQEWRPMRDRAGTIFSWITPVHLENGLHLMLEQFL